MPIFITMNSCFPIFIYTTTVVLETTRNANDVLGRSFAIGVITGSTGQEGTYNRNWQYDCGRRQNVASISQRMINGSAVSTENWPWMAGIYNSNDILMCGATLINQEYVLTAAHCFKDNDPGEFSVRLGTTLITKRTQCNRTHQNPSERNKEAKGRYSYPDAHNKTISLDETSETQVICVDVESICTPIHNICGLCIKDIALVKLTQTVNFTKHIQPICLPSNCSDITTDSPSYSAGWGKIDYYYEFDDDYNEYDDGTKESMKEASFKKAMNDQPTKLSSGSSQAVLKGVLILESPNQLMQRKIDFIDQAQCTKQMEREVPGYIVCSNGGACHGDSGGPLMYEDKGQWFLGRCDVRWARRLPLSGATIAFRKGFALRAIPYFACLAFFKPA